MMNVVGVTNQVTNLSCHHSDVNEVLKLFPDKLVTAVLSQDKPESTTVMTTCMYVRCISQTSSFAVFTSALCLQRGMFFCLEAKATDTAQVFFAFADFQDGFLSFSEFSTGALLLYQDALEDELHVLFSGSWVLLMKNGRDCDLFFHGIQFCSLDSISVSFPLKRLKRVRCELVVIEFTARSKSIEPFNKKETLGMGQVATANKVQTCFQVLVKSMFHRCRD